VLAAIDASELPIDPFRIIEHFPEIKIVTYTELRDNTDCRDPFDFDARNARYIVSEEFPNIVSHRIDAETHRIRGDIDYLMVYDDRIKNEQRIRWTIAHELGHIFIGHFVDFDKTATTRGGLSENEYGVLEVEAHYFAAAFLTPMIILKKIRACRIPEGIQEICNVSGDAAYKRYQELYKLPIRSYSGEGLLNRNFYNYMRKVNNPDQTKYSGETIAKTRWIVLCDGMPFGSSKYFRKNFSCVSAK